MKNHNFQSCPIGVRLFGLMALAVFAQSCSSTEVEKSPPEVIGVRMNANGEVAQQIIRETTDIVTTVPFTPEGPHRSGEKHSKYFLEEKGQPRRELSTTITGDFNYCDSFLPVENSSRWVGAKMDQNAIDLVKDANGEPVSYTCEFNIIVFDDQHAITHRKFIAIPMDALEEPFKLGNGNRFIIFDSPQGRKQYDVVTDSVANVP